MAPTVFEMPLIILSTMKETQTQRSLFFDSPKTDVKHIVPSSIVVLISGSDTFTSLNDLGIIKIIILIITILIMMTLTILTLLILILIMLITLIPLII